MLMLKRICLLLSVFIAFSSFGFGIKSPINFKMLPVKPLSLTQQRAQQLVKYNQNLLLPQIKYFNQQLKISGFTNFDIHPKKMQKTLAGEEKDYFALSNLGINVRYDPNTFLHFYAAGAYFKTNKGQGDRNKNTGLMLDDGHLTIMNYQYPWFMQLGRFYLPFGQYNRYAIVSTLAQLLTITRAMGIQTGFINWHHFTGSIYLVQGALHHSKDDIQGNLNGGLALHYQQKLDTIVVKTGVEYMYNMLNTNAISESDPFQPTNNSNTPLFPVANSTFTDRTAGVAAQLQLQYRFLSLYGHYVTATSQSNDILRRYSGDNRSGAAIMGARPSAWDLGTKIQFLTYGKPSEADITYSRSNETGGLIIFNSTQNHPMPRARGIYGYTLHWNQYLLFRFQWTHDWLQKKGHGDNNHEGDDITIRAGLRF